MDEFRKDEILDEQEAAAESVEAAAEAEGAVENVEEAIEEVAEETAEAAAEEAAEEIAEEAAEEIAEEKSELEAELEEIRDMFQKELDAAREGNDTEMLIQELDEEVAAEEEENLPKCECCGENPCSQDYGEGYPYCDSCRETMKRYPIRFSGVLALIVGIGLIILTGYLSMPALDSSIRAADIVMNFESGRLMSALQGGYSYLASGDQSNVSKKVVKKMIDGYLKAGYNSDAVSLIETYYSETALKMPWNKKYQKIIDDTAIFQETYFVISEIIEPVANGDKYDYDEVMNELDSLKTADPKADNPDSAIDEYSDVFIEFYKFVVMSVNERTVEEQLSQLKKLDEIGEGYEWIYLANLCNVAAKAGDEETVNDSFNRLIEINCEDTSAYLSKASYYRFLETPDPDKILELCKEAEAHAPSGDLSYKQYEAIAYLLKGEDEKAFEAISEAISTSYTVQTCNLYALCGLNIDDEDAYKEMKSILENNGYSISELVEKFRKGKLTIEEVLADKGGDI